MSILTTVLPAPTEVITGPWPEGFIVYDWDPKIIASANGHYGAYLGSFGTGDAGKASFGVYIVIYEYPFDRISYMPLFPRVLHVTLEPVGTALYVHSQTPAGMIWWHLPSWRPFGALARMRRAAGRMFGRRAVSVATMPRTARLPAPSREWLAEFDLAAIA